MRWILARGCAGSVLLVVAGWTYSKLPVGTWALDAPLLGQLRASPDRLQLGPSVALVGLLLLTSAWWSLVRRASARRDGVRLARLATAAWTAPLLLAPPLFSNDGWSYVATGYLAGHHMSPYVVTPSVLPPPLLSGVAVIWRHTTSPYGPVTLVWGAVFSRFTDHPWLLLLAQRGLAFVGLALLALAVPRLARRAGHDPARASAVVLASPYLVAHGIGGLHNDLVMVGLAAAALCVTRRDRWWWGAVLAGLAASVKAPGEVIAVGVVLLSLVPDASVAARLGRAVRVVAVSGGALVLVSLGSGLGLGWLRGLAVTAGEPARLAPVALLGRGAGLLLDATGPVGHLLVTRAPPVVVAKDVGVALMVAVVGWVLLRFRIPDERAAIVGAAVAMGAVTLLGPALHYWYLLWFVPLVACLPLSRRGERAYLGLVSVLGLSAVADPALHVGWLTWTALVGLVATPLVAWLAARRGEEAAVGSGPASRRTLGPS